MRPASASRIPETELVDAGRLDAQTMGDLALQRELLDLLLGQIDRFSLPAASAGEDDLVVIAHALKGAAGAVGATALEAAARRCEEEPSAATRTALLAAMERLSAFIRGLSG